MAYSANYTEADISASVVNTIAKVLITVGTLITVIVVVMLYSWVRKHF
jgi:hypothetical protein